jgi:outer membrane immunogenic protein
MLGAASALLMTSAGHAADAVAAAPSGFNWSGFYVGVGGGFGAVNHKASTNFLGPDASLNGIGGEGVFGELTAGYDHMLSDRVLLGGFIDVHAGNIGPTLGISGGTVDLTNSYGFDAVARLGYVLNGSTLGYALGGYTWQHFKLEGTPPAGTPGAFEFSEDRSGYVLGVGMETALSGNWTIKAEYRYANYGNDTVLGDPAAVYLNVEPSTHTFHVAANYRFGAGGAGPAVDSPAYDWTGFYVGGALGAGEVVHDLSTPLFGGLDFNGIGGEGVFGELSVGYDHDFGNFVAGIMVDGNVSGISTDIDVAPAGTVASVKADYGFDVLGRIGMKVNPSTLAYVLGGYSWGHFKAEADPVLLGGGSYDWSSSGFSVGGGLETAVASRTTLGIEYRYSQFQSEDFDSGGAFEVKPSSHTVRVGMKYKFN